VSIVAWQAMENAQKSFWWAVGSCAAMLLGGFGPWARVFGFVSVSGTDAGDGWFVVLAALLAGGLIIFRQRRRLATWPVVVALLAALIALAVAIYDWTDLNHIADRTGIVSPGWGIYVSTLASASLALACVALLVEKRPVYPPYEPAPPPPPTQ
jgi:MYXO-CTERM domain-containing protein